MNAPHNNNFDLIRLLAALQVLQIHGIESPLSLPLPAPVAFFFAQFPGVVVFFVVSGFLVTRSYLQGEGGASAYFVRRALRIYPALWVNMAAIVLLLGATGSLASLSFWRWIAWFAVTDGMGSEIAGNYLVGVITQPGGFYPRFPSGVTWTLMVEIGFYLLLPLIVFGPLREKRFAWASVSAWAALSLAVAYYYFHLTAVAPDAALTKLLSVNPLTDLWEFMLGAICSIYWNEVKRFFEGRFLLWLAVYIAAAILMHLYFGVNSLNSHASTPFMPLMTALLAGVVLSFAYTWRGAAAVLRGSDLSYGIYLYHMPIVVTLGLLGYGRDASVWLVLVGGSLVLAALSWYLIERPALRLKEGARRLSAHPVPE